MRIAVIADTHLPRRGSVLPEACRVRIAGADLLVHAGDLADMAALAHLRGLGPPLVAVHGNVDEPEVRAALPATAEADLDGLRLAVVHDAGPEPGRPRSLRARFPRADVVVFGHSHVPYLARHGGMTALNPGSPTDRRRQPRHSMAEILIDPSGAPQARFWDLDPPGGRLAPELVRAPRG